MATTDEESAQPLAPLQELASLAASQLRSGKLPRTGFSAVFAGPGKNERCALCSEVIGAASVSYEVNAPQADGNAALNFHIPCFNAWKQACHEAGD